MEDKNKDHNESPDYKATPFVIGACLAAEVVLFLISAVSGVEIPITIHIIIGGVLGIGNINNLLGGKK